MFTDMLDIDALVQKCTKLMAMRYKQRYTMIWGEMRSARARVKLIV